MMRAVRSHLSLTFVVTCMAALVITGASANEASGDAAASPLGTSWTLYHSFNGGKDFTRRGVIGWNAEEQELEVRNDDECLSLANLEQAKEAGWYQVKLVPDDESSFAMATVPACSIQRANFRDEFSLLINRDDALLSMAYNPLISPLAPKDCADMDTDRLAAEGGIKFSSKAALELDKPGMVIRPVLPQTKPPPGLNFIPNPNKRSADAAAMGIPPDEKEAVTGPVSFIKRYWYVVLPLFISSFIGTEPPPEGEEGQQQEGGSGAAAVAGGAAVGAAAVAAAGGRKERRGKKG